MSAPNRNVDPVHASLTVEHAGKTFILDHKSNHRGHYVKLVECVAGRRDTTLLPIEVVVDVARFLGLSAQRAGVLKFSTPKPK